MNVRACRILLLALLLSALATLARAAEPGARDEALRLVPDDVGLCFVVQDLRGHAAALADSPFLEHFRRSPLGQALRESRETAKLLELEKRLRQDLHLDWAQLRDDIFGDAVVMAYRPGPPGQPEAEMDLFVLRARDGRLLADLLDRLNRVQKERKELKALETREYDEQTYYRRVERDHESFYFLRGPLLALSSKEAVLRQAIDRDRHPAEGEPALARQLRRLASDGRLAALWINPRAFDAEMERKAATSPKPSEAAFTRAFLVYWKALDGIALSFDLDTDAALALTLRARVQDLPAAARHFFATAAEPSDLWERFPPSALLATAARLDVAALFELAGDFLAKNDRAALVSALQGRLGAPLDKDAVQDILPNIGPDVGLCVAAPPAGDAAWFPQVLFAVRVRPGPQRPPVDEALLSALNSFALVAVAGYNATHPDRLSLKHVTEDGVAVKFFAHEHLPPGLRPAYALKDGYLLLASAPEVIGRFGAAAPRPAAGVPLLRLSAKELCRYLADHREPLAQASAETNQISRAEAERRLNGLLDVLQLFDQVEVRRQPAERQLLLALRLQPAWPLRR
jgi:hypothetical protein